MSIMEYETKFSTLDCFTQEQLSSDCFKAIHFESSLRTYIRWGLATRPITTFANVVMRALSIETTDLELKRGREGTTLVKSTNLPKKAKSDIGSHFHQQQSSSQQKLFSRSSQQSGRLYRVNAIGERVCLR